MGNAEFLKNVVNGFWGLTGDYRLEAFRQVLSSGLVTWTTVRVPDDTPGARSTLPPTPFMDQYCTSAGRSTRSACERDDNTSPSRVLRTAAVSDPWVQASSRFSNFVDRARPPLGHRLVGEPGWQSNSYGSSAFFPRAAAKGPWSLRFVVRMTESGGARRANTASPIDLHWLSLISRPGVLTTWRRT